MTAPQVFLDIDLTPQPTSGLGYFYPTTQVTDPTDGITLTKTAQGFPFDGTLKSIQLYATDNANMGPAGWAWFLDFSQNPSVPGKPTPVTFFAPAGPLAFTATNANPAVFTWTSNAAFMAAFPANILPNGTAIVLSGTAPTGFTNGTTYYVVNSSALHFSLAATRGGAAIASTSTGTGTFIVTRYTYSGLVPQGSTATYSPFLSNPSGSATQGYGVTANANGLPAWTASTDVPVTQVVPLPVTSTYADLYKYTVSGQTDSTVSPFGWVIGSQTYTSISGNSSVQGPAFWTGYNPDLLSARVNTSAHGAIGISCFGQAGDSFNPATGGRGLEFNMGFRTPNGLKATNFFEAVGCDDNTNTVTLSLRIGDGSYHSDNGQFVGSQFSLVDVASNLYMSAGPFNNTTQNGPGITFGAPIQITNLPYLNALSTAAMSRVYQATNNLSESNASVSGNVTSTWTSVTGTASYAMTGAGNASFVVQSTGAGASFSMAAAGSGAMASANFTSANGTAQFIVNGNNTASSVNAQMVWQKSGTNTWVMEDSGGSAFYLLNNSGNPQMLLLSGTNTAGNYDNALTDLLSKVQVFGSLVVSSGANLATTATKGFFYLPGIAGAPTGVPVANAGSFAATFDPATNKLWVYNGTAWKGTVLA